jgi:nucleotide-binding universal stress UspA family protein
MRFLVATDLSSAGDEALRQTALRVGTGDTLAVVTVVPPAHAVSGWLASREAKVDLEPQQVRTRAEDALRKTLAAVGHTEAEIFVEEGSAYAEIVKRSEAWHADLLVVGSHGHTGLARWLGGVAERVVRHASCDVLVARAAPVRGRVIAATDLSELSRPALTAGVAEAHRRGTTLEIVHAVGFLDLEMLYLTELGAAPVDAATTLPVDRARDQLSTFVRETGVNATCKVLDGAAAAAVVREAEEIGAELIVVGAHGKTGLKRFLIGNIAEKIARNAPCSVLVARSGHAGEPG